MCATCNQEVKEMKPRFFLLLLLFLFYQHPLPTSPSEAPRNVCGFRRRCRRLRSSGGSAMMSAVHTGTFLNKGKSVWLGW